MLCKILGTLLELLKNSIVKIRKIVSIVHFNQIQTDQELIFQQFYYIVMSNVHFIKMFDSYF
ncbi:hypothetical protein B1J93_02930 [Leptospira kirschneri serovar Pomona]|uniref:Uncharacterized protein n=1 Tax=Leptospira kirschneri serovar Pomona TaxID=561005 RepID=A0A1T1E144_9LEPT|nr:hypothetical protein B1J93_02930 [Leptospira kirschneri serovar Pomona]